MVSKQLDRISREIDRIWSADRDAATCDETALDGLNVGIRDVIAETARRLEAWALDLDTRVGLQRRVWPALEEDEGMRRMWWNEQHAYYADLVEQMDRTLNYDDTATVTFSLTAVEVLVLVRLLKEEGILQTETLRPLFRYLSRYGRTERYDKLSYDSLKKRYSLRHEGARKNIKKILMNLIKRIDQKIPGD